uniref:Uncharacterized protein n=1 Tax=Setaria digitata TaxID=48799 RepID=A0A915PK45_9BILA
MLQPQELWYKKVVKTVNGEQSSQQEPSSDPQDLLYYEKIIEALHIGQLIYEVLLQQSIIDMAILQSCNGVRSNEDKLIVGGSTIEITMKETKRKFDYSNIGIPRL